MSIYRVIVSFVLILASASIACGEENGARKAALALDPGFEAGRQWFISISISAYEEWPSLAGPKEDAEALLAVLTSDYYIDKVVTLHDRDATRANIAKLFVMLQKEVRTHDSLLIFYAGHGYLDKSSDTGFWIPADAGKSVFEQRNWITNSQVRGYISNLKSTHVCMIMDSCFGGDMLASERGKPGEIGADYFKKAYRRTSRQVLTSGATEKVPDKSEFALLLVSALEKNTSPYIDPLMLYDEIRLGVTSTTPLFGYLRSTGHQEGASFILFRKPQKFENNKEQLKNETDEERVLEEVRGSMLVSSDFDCDVYFDGKKAFSLTIGIEKKIDNMSTGSHIIEARSGRESLVKRVEVLDNHLIAVRFHISEKRLSEKMAVVNGGTFIMGAKEGVSHERPAHEVALQSFSIARHETTFAEYDEYCEATGRAKPDDRGWGRGTRPVIFASWLDAIEYCNWLSKKEGYTQCYTVADGAVAWDFSANGYRLPTEAEWEYAAGAGIADEDIKYAGSFECYSVAWYKENSKKHTSEVGKKKPNALGLFDMSGNVWEWCWDFYGANYYAESPSDSPPGPDSGTNRVLRGGSWYNGSNYQRVTCRGHADQKEKTDMFGFRVARSVR